MARMLWPPDYPWGPTEEVYRELEERRDRFFGPRREALRVLRNEMGFTGVGEAHPWSSATRAAQAPGAMREYNLMNRQIDARHVLPAIRVPTLIVHGTDDAIPVEGAHYMARRISSAVSSSSPGPAI